MRLLRSYGPVTTLLVCGLAGLPAFCQKTGASPDGTSTLPAPASKSKQSGSDWKKDPADWKVVIYPVYGWVPVFGASLNTNLPSLPDVPASPTAGTVSSSFNGAGFAGFDIEKSRVTVNGGFLYVSVSADNTHPALHLGLDALYGQVMGGYKILREVSLEGGVRRLDLNISASFGTRPGLNGKPGFWDPIIGTTWKHQASRKWQFLVHLDGGGFGVGSDVSIQATGRADYRFVKHAGVTMGFAALHFQTSNTVFDNTRIERTLKMKQTLYGPIIGLGLWF